MLYSVVHEKINYLRNGTNHCRTGNLKQDRESPNFMSAIGHTDKRVKLDKTISRKDSKYYGALSAMAAKIAYENEAFIKNTVENHWKVELLLY